MPTLHAGLDKSQKPRPVSLTDGQWTMLGFQSGERPKKIGCGAYGCTYLPKKADSVVKITKDANDALAAWMIKQAGNRPSWVIPIHAVYRLPKSTFAICAAKADPLPEEWAAPIEIIYRYAEEEDILASEWEEAYKAISKEIDYATIKHGRQTDDDKQVRRALELINECVLEFRKIGLDWEDFHDYNFLMYNGRPVVIDLGAVKIEPDLRSAQMPAMPEEREIPVLPF